MNWNNLEIPNNPFYSDDAVTIYNADCREILPQLPDNSVDLVLTDPPYNGDIDYGGGTNDSRDWGDYLAWLVPIIKDSERVSFGPVIYFVSHHGLIKIIEWYKPYWVGAWFQPSPSGNPIGRVGASLIMPYFEPYLFYGDLKSIKAAIPDAIYANISKGQVRGHPCPKPIIVMQKLINSGDFNIILDPFLGSGTTCYCAKKLGRKCIGIEIEERYCEIAARRCSQGVLLTC